MTRNLRFLILLLFIAPSLFAGNPDRQGEAGAYELVLNPWARSAGLHSINIGSVSGVEAMRINPAGLDRIHSTEILLSQTRYLVGADINLNAMGFAKKIGKHGAFGVSIMAIDFGEIKVTTDAQPEGTGVTYSPSFFNLGVGYSHAFDKVNVGVLFRVVNESTSDIKSSGIALDAGVQYVTGERDNIKFGIAIRNIGTPMKFSGPGLATNTENAGKGGYNLTYSVRGATYELPSLLSIGLSIKTFLTDKHTLTFDGGFTANSFAQDQIGIGAEYSFNNKFMLRGAYKLEMTGGGESKIQSSVDNGPSFGASIDIPLKKKDLSDILGEGDKSEVKVEKKEPPRFGLDYAYKLTNPFGGIHTLGIRLNF
ncbi:MAG TPA: PorV/PorQ family protein [Saprospiraceae bacterium]|nr:PorV/PorQ family protein [Saprospiraceae bacterium]